LANYNTKLELNVNYLSERKDEIEMMNLIDNFKGVKVSKVLLDKRIPLCNSIYPFSRLNTDEKLLQWSQHIGACLWWQNKLSKYNGYMDDGNIQFDTANARINFRKKFNFVSGSTANMDKLNDIERDNRKTWRDWMDEHFPTFHENNMLKLDELKLPATFQFS
jgi:hypothetical protein